MAFNIINPGDRGLAQIVMENFRHVGRMSWTSHYGLDQNGNYFLQNLGDAEHPWNNVYLDAGAQIFIGGVPLAGGGGGSGSGIDQCLQNIINEQNGLPAVPQNSAAYDSFLSQNNIIYTLREPYAAGSGQIRLDLNAQLVDEMDSTSGWNNAGSGSGSSAYTATTSDKVHGTGSIKITLTNYTGEQHIEKTVTQFSIKDSVFRVSVKPSTLVNVNHLRVVLGNGTSTNRARFFVPAAQLSANVWNVITICGDDAPDETAGTWDTGNINFIALSVVTSSSQTLTCNWDYAVTVDLPENIEIDQQRGVQYPHRQDIYDNSYKSDMCLMSEGTGRASRGVYTLGAPLTDINSGAQVAYTDTAATVSKFKELTSVNGSGTIPVLSGNAQKWVVQRTMRYLPETINSKTLQAAVNFNPTKQYKVSSLPNTATIIVQSDTNDAAMFPAVDVKGNPTEILAYNLINNGFKKFTLTAAASYSSPNLTFGVAESTSGLDTSTWYAIKSPILSARVEDASQAGELVRGEVKGIHKSKGSLARFFDDFNRPDGAVGNGWENTPYSGSYSTWNINSNKLLAANAANSAFLITAFHDAIGTTHNDDFIVSLIFGNVDWTQARSLLILLNPHRIAGSQAYDFSLGVKVDVDANFIRIGTSTNPGNFTAFSSGAYDFGGGANPNTNTNIKIEKRNRLVTVKAWDISNVEPLNYIVSYNFSESINTVPAQYVGIVGYTDGSQYGSFSIDDFLVKDKSLANVIVYSLPNQTGNKITTSLALPIADSANENPTVSGIAAYLG